VPKIQPILAPFAFILPKYSQKGNFSLNFIWKLIVRVFQKTEEYVLFTNQTKINSTENSNQEKIMISVEKITKRHLGNLRHFEIFPLTKTDGKS
jgi:hypothetical protein